MGDRVFPKGKHSVTLFIRRTETRRALKWEGLNLKRNSNATGIKVFPWRWLLFSNRVNLNMVIYNRYNIYPSDESVEGASSEETFQVSLKVSPRLHSILSRERVLFAISRSTLTPFYDELNLDTTEKSPNFGMTSEIIMKYFQWSNI